MTIKVQFNSLFLYILIIIGFPLSVLFPAQKIRNNTEEAPFGKMGASTEPKKNLMFKKIVKRDIGFLL